MNFLNLPTLQTAPPATFSSQVIGNSNLQAIQAKNLRGIILDPTSFHSPLPRGWGSYRLHFHNRSKIKPILTTLTASILVQATAISSLASLLQSPSVHFPLTGLPISSCPRQHIPTRTARSEHIRLCLRPQMPSKWPHLIQSKKPKSLQCPPRP